MDKSLRKELSDILREASPAMSKAAAEKLKGEAFCIMEQIDRLRLMAMLACKAEGLGPDDARSVFQKMASMLDEVHNDIDLLREELEREAA